MSTSPIYVIHDILDAWMKKEMTADEAISAVAFTLDHKLPKDVIIIKSSCGTDSGTKIAESVPVDSGKPRC